MNSSRLRKSLSMSSSTSRMSKCILHPLLATKYELSSSALVFSSSKSSILSSFMIRCLFSYRVMASSFTILIPEGKNWWILG